MRRPLRIRRDYVSYLLAFSAACIGCQRHERSAPNPAAGLNLPVVEAAPGGDRAEPEVGNAAEDDWAQARLPREMVFPRDHAAHPDFRIEWWYYTGNLQAADGSRWGYQLTFFRTGVVQQPQNPSRWAVRDLYTAHVAISDLSRRRHRFAQRTRRQGIGQAGAAEDRYDVWNDDWSVQLHEDRHLLKAETGEFALSLELVATKPLVLHGDGGLSRKGASDGNASYYYSATRMATIGSLTVDGRRHEVRGESWMDHEFSTSFLEPGQLGWDWFSIQLDDQSELMLYQIRRQDGTPDPFSSGTHVNPQGQVTRLSAADFQLEPLSTWKSPQTGGNYPLSWRVRIPSLGYELTVKAAFPEQEMTTQASVGLSYWEGSIAVQGQGRGRPVTGRGYLELTGYAGDLPDQGLARPRGKRRG